MLNANEYQDIYISKQKMIQIMTKLNLAVNTPKFRARSRTNTPDFRTINLVNQFTEVDDFVSVEMESKSPPMGIVISSEEAEIESEVDYVELIQNKIIGLAFSFLSLAGMSLYALLTKYFAEISVDLILFFLAGFYFIFILCEKLYYKNDMSLQLPLENAKWCLLAAVFEVTDNIARIISVVYIPAELAVGISCCTPIVASILEIVFIPGEFPFSIAVARIGVALIITGGLILHTYGTVSILQENYYTVVGIIWSLVALICRVHVNLVIRREKLRTPGRYHLSHWYIARIMLLIPTGIVLHFCFSDNAEGLTSLWTQRAVLASAILGFMYLIGSIGMVGSHGFIPASTAISIRTIEIPLVFVITTSYMHEKVNAYSISGCVISFLGCIAMEIFFSSI